MNSLLHMRMHNRKEDLTINSPDTLTSMNHLALLYDSQGQYGKAEPLFVACLQQRRMVLPTG